MDQNVVGKAKYMEISAKIIRKNGTVEDLGIVSRSSGNWWKNCWFKIIDNIKKIINRIKKEIR